MPPTYYKVFVRGFDFGTSEETLKEHFAQAGSVVFVQGYGKGGAIVTYATEEEANWAVKHLHGTTVQGNQRYIEVKIHRMGGGRGIASGSGSGQKGSYQPPCLGFGETA